MSRNLRAQAAHVTVGARYCPPLPCRVCRNGNVVQKCQTLPSPIIPLFRNPFQRLAPHHRDFCGFVLDPSNNPQNLPTGIAICTVVLTTALTQSFLSLRSSFKCAWASVGWPHNPSRMAMRFHNSLLYSAQSAHWIFSLRGIHLLTDRRITRVFVRYFVTFRPHTDCRGYCFSCRWRRLHISHSRNVALVGEHDVFLADHSLQLLFAS